MTADKTGRDWLAMGPQHFDASLLPRTRKAAAGQDGLFSLADVAPAKVKPARPGPELEGQLDMLSLLDGTGEP